ncbi:MAG: riboflavin synthase [Sphingosinicella sp.]
MFTGIVTDIGRIEAVEPQGGRIRIQCGYETGGIDFGASIACSGVCLTVVDKGPGWFAVDVTPETQARTATDMWTKGRHLNLERALKVGDELGGHIVTGHVDGVGTVTGAVPDGDSLRVTIQAPRSLAPYLAEKGSIAVNGVSLTLTQVEDTESGVEFGITIIPHTRDTTAMFAAGDMVNLEIDLITRYLARLLDSRASTVPAYPLPPRG